MPRLSYLTSLSFAMYFRSDKEEANAGLLELRCSDLQARQKSLQQAMRRSRSEWAGKAAALTRQSEEKMSFLLQQLKESEARTRRAEDTLRSSGITMSTATSPANTDKDVGANFLDSGFISRRSSVATNQRLSTGKALLDSQTDVMSRSQSAKDVVRLAETIANINNTDDSDEKRDKIERKWRAEKQRREQLEKRNGELNRELRSFREKLQDIQKSPREAGYSMS